ncbi:hypothetical protein E2562_034767 [Oryza meyeriana var. granulata]|uniref:Cyclin-like domain-containing protein n=1 Tax=Oryza meyeriana var. granulata TaxID=110450 RepID=A0A6G1CKQ0_9ORYZ|nr:hypothetical protein E2562_034767 [Oryza meyeriana var. granulata]
MLAAIYGSTDGVRYCQQCQRTTSMLLDHATGDAICTECPLLLGDASSDRRWRGADDGNDRGRLGGGADAPADDPLLPGSEVGATGVGIAYSAAPPKLQADAGAAPRVRGAVPTMNKALAEGFDAITDMGNRLGLADAVSDLGKEVLRKLEEAKACPRGRSRDALYAACLHAACRIEGSPRTLKELAAATPDAAATKRDIGKFINVIKRHLGKEEAGQDQADVKSGGGVVVRAGDYLLRYGSAVGMSDQERSDGGTRKSVREVSAATGISESTIKDACKDLCPHAALLFG